VRGSPASTEKKVAVAAAAVAAGGGGFAAAAALSFLGAAFAVGTGFTLGLGHGGVVDVVVGGGDVFGGVVVDFLFVGGDFLV